ncbi:MAG: PIG-L deacetylase family protein [bacterium]|nr:PIG-L deacetylase family protein [bacterium]
MSKKAKRILAIGAHPDDLDFSCAGTTAKLTREGDEFFYLIVSDGSKGGIDIKLNAKKLVEVRKKEQAEAAKFLKVKNVTFLGLKDGEVENTKSLRREIVREIRKIKPDTVFCFDPSIVVFDNPYRFHRDHRQSGEAAFDAIYPASSSPFFFPELLKQGHKPHQIKEIWFFSSSKPNKFINITSTIDSKLKALSFHRSQIADMKAVEKRVRDWAKKSGKKSGYKYAEAFRIIKFRQDNEARK